MLPINDAIKVKEDRHRAQCAAAGYGYCTAAWTVFGAVAGDFYTGLVSPHFTYQLKLAKRNGDDPWQIHRRKAMLLDRWSIVIARHVARAIRANSATRGECSSSSAASSGDSSDDSEPFYGDDAIPGGECGECEDA